MIEYVIMALTFVVATGVSYQIGHRDGFAEGVSALQGVDEPRTLH